jgi:sialate O-acetylesterase
MKKILLLFVLQSIWIGSLRAQFRFANIFSDNMVIQAHKPIKIWGNAAPGEVVKVSLDKQQKTTTTDKRGKWMLEFAPMDYGDPVIIKGVGEKNKVELKNILIGEVWLCSGQSNMAMTINGAGGQVYNYKNEESNAQYPDIRMYNVKPNLSASVGIDIEGKWDICSPETVSDFSAVAYFFARKIYQETGIPIGIINSSWGGTDIETWISMETFKRLPYRFKTKYKDAEVYGVEAVLKNNEDNRNAFAEAVSNDIGIEEEWYSPSHNTDSWKLMSQPQEWSGTELEAFDGVVWFKYKFSLSDADAGQPGVLSLGKVDDIDITWINGEKVGETN